MIRRLIILLLIVGCVFAQDEYPYFSDMTKQMEFEKQTDTIKSDMVSWRIILVSSF